ncbi:MAG: hypothetical protein MJZ41_10615 [Bacteroidaceae bacterium]|nr:hypothetical protein [Bacteroidaceae bacterium]
MKKLLFGLVAFVSVVCLTLSISSCSKDDDDTTKVDVAWILDIDGDENTTPENVKKEAYEIGLEMEKRILEIYGGRTFKLPADTNTNRPSIKDIHDAKERFSNDSKIKGYIEQLRAINAKYGKKYVESVRFTIYCENGELGSDKINII